MEDASIGRGTEDTLVLFAEDVENFVSKANVHPNGNS